MPKEDITKPPKRPTDEEITRTIGMMVVALRLAHDEDDEESEERAHELLNSIAAMVYCLTGAEHPIVEVVKKAMNVTNLNEEDLCKRLKAVTGEEVTFKNAGEMIIAKMSQSKEELLRDTEKAKAMKMMMDDAKGLKHGFPVERIARAIAMKLKAEKDQGRDVQFDTSMIQMLRADGKDMTDQEKKRIEEIQDEIKRRVHIYLAEMESPTKSTYIN